MDAGTLQLKLMADISGLTAGMNSARDHVSSSMATMSSAVDVAKTALVGLVGIGSVGAFATMINSTIAAQGALQDLATKTGASAAALDAFRVIGSTSETSIDKVTDAMNKLGKNMVTATNDGKGASAAMAALGLNFDTVKGMKPEDQMLAVATAMNGFADGADKGAVAQELFGKQGAALLPFLKDLGNDADKVSTALTEQEVAYRKTQAAMADAFGDNLTLIARETGQWKRDIAEGMTPALYSASAAFLSIATESGGMKDKINEMSRDGTFTNWTRNAITGLTYVMDAFEGVGAVAVSVGKVIGAWAAGVGSAVTTAFTAFKQAAAGDFSGAMATMRGGMEQQKSIAQDLATSLDDTWGAQTLGSKLRDRIADITDTGVAAEDIKPKMNYSGVLEKNETAHKANTKEAKLAEQAANALATETKKQEEAYLKLNASIAEKIAAMELEMEQGTELTKSQKLENQLYQDLANSVRIMTDEQLDNTLAQINNMRATEDKYAAYKLDQAQTQANAKENAEFSEKLMKSTDDTNAQAEKIREHTATLGLNKEELEALIIQKGYDAAATYDQRAAWADKNWLGDNLVKQFKDQATALRALADAKQEGIHVKAAVEARLEWEKTTESIGKGLSSALATSIMQGKDLWLTFRDYMVRTLLDGVLKNALTSVIGGGINDLITGITGVKIGTGTGSSLLSTALNAAGSTVSDIASGVASTLGIGTPSVGYGIATGTGASIAAAEAAIAAGAPTTAALATSQVAALTGAPAATTAASTLGTVASAVPIVAGVVGVIDMLGGWADRNDPSRWGYDPNDPTSVAAEQARLDALAARRPIDLYASGGDFAGGLRIVGENGPEMEATGPSRIFDAQTTASMLRSGGASSDEVVAELRAMRQQLAQLHQETRRGSDALNGLGESPMIVEVDA